MTDRELVFYLAALVSVPESVATPARSQEINDAAALNLYRFAAESGVKRMVYSSSAAVYGNQPVPHRESMCPNPVESPYAMHKLLGEYYGMFFHKRSGLTSIFLRYFNVYGPHQSPGSPYSGVISIFMQRAKEGLPVTIYGDGEQTRDFVYVSDVVVANLLAAFKEDLDRRVVREVTINADALVTALSSTVFESLWRPIVEKKQKNDISEFVKELNLLDQESLSALLRDHKLKIDTAALVKDLGSKELNPLLQIFFTGNHRFIANLAEMNRRAAVETNKFIDTELLHALFHTNQMNIVEQRKSEIMQLDGHILDLGVYKGDSTKALARIFPDRIIHGFDSFEGLPEDWAHAPKGTFGNMQGLLPTMPQNVRLYKGWFDETLPVWFKENNELPISLLRVDCDLYSSTKVIFDILYPLIGKGTWIIFDELIGYRGWKFHEYKALQEFLVKSKLEFDYIAFGLTYVMGYLK